MSKESFKVKVGLAEMLKGGVIMDVTNVEQAKIAEDAGAVSVMALERIPSDIRKDGGVARMSNPHMIKEIQENSSIQIIVKMKNNEAILELLTELLNELKELSNLKKIESLEKELINNLDENSYSELIKLKNQLNRE